MEEVIKLEVIKSLAGLISKLQLNPKEMAALEVYIQEITKRAVKKAKEEFKEEWDKLIEIAVDDKIEFGFGGRDINLKGFLLYKLKGD